MNGKNKIFIAYFLLFCLTSKSQTKLSGIIKNTDNIAVNSASIIVKDSLGKVVAYCYSDYSGNCFLNINLTQEVLQDEFYIVMNVTNRSGWRYGLCIAAAVAGSVLCHAGCDTTALATTAGLGIPACVWACGTLQVMASVQCYDSYGG